MSKISDKTVRAVVTNDADLGRIVGRSLKSLRAVAGLTQADIADRMNVAPSTISKIENVGDIQISTLRRYVSALGAQLRIDAIFDRDAYAALSLRHAFDPEPDDTDQLAFPIFGDQLFKPAKDVVLSIKPQFSEKIVAGKKKVELRRRFPISAPRGAMAYIYSTSPTRAMIGSVEIAGVQKLPLGDIWKQYSKVAHIARDDFEHYFSGLTEGFAISFENAQRFSRAVELTELRKRFDFEPPQSFLYASPLLRTALRNEYASLSD